MKLVKYNTFIVSKSAFVDADCRVLLHQGPVLLLRHDAVTRILAIMGVQLSLKAVLPLAGILATASDRCSKTGPRASVVTILINI